MHRRTRWHVNTRCLSAKEPPFHTIRPRVAQELSHLYQYGSISPLQINPEAELSRYHGLDVVGWNSNPASLRWRRAIREWCDEPVGIVFVEEGGQRGVMCPRTALGMERSQAKMNADHYRWGEAPVQRRHVPRPSTRALCAKSTPSPRSHPSPTPTIDAKPLIVSASASPAAVPSPSPCSSAAC